MSQPDNKNRVNVTIYGENYRMCSSSSPEYMLRLAKYVDEKMGQIAQTYNHLGLNRIAVLTAVNLADELFRARREIRELQNQLYRKNVK
ncbi:MAG: cell division protein ZapA [Firmicutes bacterium]|nr:cell division protein ZapA [Bacillota bacterium]